MNSKSCYPEFTQSIKAAIYIFKKSPVIEKKIVSSLPITNRTRIMLILLSCAKTMCDASPKEVPLTTRPLYEANATEIAFQMAQCTVNDLERLLKVNAQIAVENYKRYQHFHSEDSPHLPAILAYTGIVFKRLGIQDFSDEDFLYAQEHLRLTSFCYGLLRPLDLIRPYRLEGNIVLPEPGDITLFDYWKAQLTDNFISDIRKAGGVLCNLASEEMKNLFDWKQVEQSARIITPEFRVRKGGRWKTIVIYTKMSRGEMTRFILKNRIEVPEQIKTFEWEGFEWNESLSTENNWIFTNEG